MQQWGQEQTRSNMKKIITLIFLTLFLNNCAGYKPLINPETSRDKWDGENIAGNYWKNLQHCNYIWEETYTFRMPFEKADQKFLRKCMNSYGYTILN